MKHAEKSRSGNAEHAGNGFHIGIILRRTHDDGNDLLKFVFLLPAAAALPHFVQKHVNPVGQFQMKARMALLNDFSNAAQRTADAFRVNGNHRLLMEIRNLRAEIFKDRIIYDLNPDFFQATAFPRLDPEISARSAENRIARLNPFCHALHYHAPFPFGDVLNPVEKRFRSRIRGGTVVGNGFSISVQLQSGIPVLQRGCMIDIIKFIDSG